MRGTPRTTTTTAGPLRLTEVVVSDAFAGTERYVVDTAVGLARRGHDVHVVGGSPEVMPDRLGAGVRWSPGSSVGEAVRALTRDGRRDVVHGHMTRAEFAAAAAAPVTRGRRIATRHIMMPRGHGRPARALGRLVRAEMWAEIAVSRYVADGVRPRSEAVLLNGTDVVDDSLLADVGPEAPPVLLVAQRLEVEKSTDVVLAAFARSGLTAQGWRLVIAGRGPAEDDLRCQARDLGIEDSVDVLGWVPDVGALMRSSAIFVAAAPREPCGLSVLEAMAHGLPVVASDAGGHQETVGSSPGAMLFDVGDAQGCADRLRTLATDVALRQEYAAELLALQRNRFSLDAHVDGLESLYRAATRGERPSSPAPA